MRQQRRQSRAGPCSVDSYGPPVTKENHKGEQGAANRCQDCAFCLEGGHNSNNDNISLSMLQTGKILVTKTRSNVPENTRKKALFETAAICRDNQSFAFLWLATIKPAIHVPLQNDFRL
jgi:hypothetical protein